MPAADQPKAGPVPGDRPLDGQVAVVTGAARGLGRAIAVALAGRGAHVAGVDRLPQEETLAQMQALGASGVAHRIDVLDEGSVRDCFDRVLADRGRIDILVNNAGRWIEVERRPFWEIDSDEFDEMMAINARSAFTCAKVAAGPMRAAGSGRIVNLASDVVQIGMPDLIHYVAAKAAVVGLTRAMATELGPSGVTVNAVAPGLVGTAEARAAQAPELFEAVVSSRALERPIEAGDIAEAVAWLCGPGARMVTGQTITVNGGATMGAI